MAEKASVCMKQQVKEKGGRHSGFSCTAGHAPSTGAALAAADRYFGGPALSAAMHEITEQARVSDAAFQDIL